MALEAWCKRLSGRSLQVLLVDGQNIIVQSNNLKDGSSGSDILDRDEQI